MSTEESVYNLIPKVAPASARQARHHSMYPASTPPTASTFGLPAQAVADVSNVAGSFDPVPKQKSLGATWGPVDKKSTTPTMFLRKREGEPKLPEASRFTYTDRRKAPVPTPAEQSKVVSALKARRAEGAKVNFITQNALEAILAHPPAPREGAPDYRLKPDYGRVPDYIEQVRSEIETEKQFVSEMVEREKRQAEANQPKMRLLSEEDRVSLLAALQRKWDETNRQYQNMTHLVNLDSLGKVRRKERFEAELSQLEKSIEKVSKKMVFVQDD